MEYKLTLEQYKTLEDKDLNWFITTAYKSHYITGITRPQAEILFGIYNDVFGTKEKSVGCSHCKLRICSKLGELYYSREVKITKKGKKDDEKTREND